MIVWNEKIKKSENVINAVINQLYKNNINTDGVVETFNNGKEQGCVLKIFDKYNPSIDLCIWIYLPSNRKINNHMEVIVGRHINCTKTNMWDDANLKVFTFENSSARDMHNQTRDFVVELVTKNFDKIYDIPKL